MITNHPEDKARCFVCGQEIADLPLTYNKKLNLPVCAFCQQTDAEKKAETLALESLGEDFVCGCI
jgi:DNA-directed RNA polymerase subunit N (RpoN/RPB10)